MEEIVVRIEGGKSFSYQKVVSEKQAGWIVAFLGSGEEEAVYKPTPAGKSLEPIRGDMVSLPGKSLSQKIEEAGAKTYAEKIVVVVQHLCEMGNGNTEMVEETQVKKELKKLGSYPSKFGRELSSAINDNYLYEEEGSLGVTAVGKDAIREKFSFKNKGNKTLKKKSVVKKITVSKEVEDLEILTAIDGFPGYYDLKTKADQILWILNYAFQKGIPNLNLREVCQISSKLRAEILTKDFTAHNRRNIKKSYVSMQADSKFAITHKGESYLKGLLEDDKEAN